MLASRVVITEGCGIGIFTSSIRWPFGGGCREGIHHLVDGNKVDIGKVEEVDTRRCQTMELVASFHPAILVAFTSAIR
jgi:hypothetical protein